MKGLNEPFIFEILAIVSEIPKGYVATYQQIAELADCPKNARLVGKILSISDSFGIYPCHRVIHSDGRLSAVFPNQRALLEEEGIVLNQNHKVNLKKYQWSYKKVV